jgi:hypothetical protein
MDGDQAELGAGMGERDDSCYPGTGDVPVAVLSRARHHRGEPHGAFVPNHTADEESVFCTTGEEVSQTEHARIRLSAFPSSVADADRYG